MTGGFQKFQALEICVEKVPRFGKGDLKGVDGNCDWMAALSMWKAASALSVRHDIRRHELRYVAVI